MRRRSAHPVTGSKNCVPKIEHWQRRGSQNGSKSVPIGVLSGGYGASLGESNREQNNETIFEKHLRADVSTVASERKQRDIGEGIVSITASKNMNKCMRCPIQRSDSR